MYRLQYVSQISNQKSIEPFVRMISPPAVRSSFLKWRPVTPGYPGYVGTSTPGNVALTLLPGADPTILFVGGVDDESSTRVEFAPYRLFAVKEEVFFDAAPCGAVLCVRCCQTRRSS